MHQRGLKFFLMFSNIFHRLLLFVQTAVTTAIKGIQSQPIAFFVKRPALSVLNKAVLYVRQNEVYMECNGLHVRFILHVHHYIGKHMNVLKRILWKINLQKSKIFKQTLSCSRTLLSICFPFHRTVHAFEWYTATIMRLKYPQISPRISA